MRISDWSSDVCSSDLIGQALRENSGLRVFVGQGYYDFATPFFAAEYALSRTGIPQDRIEYKYYGAGHMMYLRGEDRHRSAERRVGQECVRTCKSRGSAYPLNKKKKRTTTKKIK